MQEYETKNTANISHLDMTLSNKKTLTAEEYNAYKEFHDALLQVDPSLQITLNSDTFTSTKPIIISDVDDVILDFLTPFVAFMQSWGFIYVPQHYDTYKNFYSQASKQPIAHSILISLFHAFFAKHVYRLPILGDAMNGLKILSQDYTIIFLTLLPPEYHNFRKHCLAHLGLFNTLISIRRQKGPIIKTINNVLAPNVLYFIDDKPDNLDSVSCNVPKTKTIYFMHQQHKKTIYAHRKRDSGDIIAHDWQDIIHYVKQNQNVNAIQARSQ